MPIVDSILVNNNSSEDFYGEIIRDGLEQRILVFNEDVNDTAIEMYAMRILKWNREDKDIPVEKRKKIKIYISSEGGDVFVAGNLVDLILQSKTPIMAVGFSLVASAAFHIYLACHERVAFENSVFLIHDGDVTIQNSSKKAQDTMSFIREINDRDKDFIVGRTTMTADFYDGIYGDEYFMYADSAKEYNIVNKIVGRDCDLDYIL